MPNQYLKPIFLSVVFLTSCANNPQNSTKKPSGEKPTTSIQNKKPLVQSFNHFIEKFSTDANFQKSRTKFPLKVTEYGTTDDGDTIIYKERSEFVMVDFRQKKSTGRYDQWEQNIVVDKNNITARIEIRGIDNGIMVDYLFAKIDEVWMFVEVEDSST